MLGPYGMVGIQASVNQPVKLFEGLFINPNLTARRADQCGDILEEVQVRASLLLMGNGGGFQLATTHCTELVVGFRCHGLLLLRRHGSSHLRGSSQCTVSQEEMMP